MLGEGTFMKFGEFMASLRKGETKQVYLLCGEEHYYIKKAEAAIMESLFPNGEGKQEALQILHGEVDFDDLIGMLETAPFFADKTVILWRDTSIFKEKKDKGKERDKKQERFLKLLADWPEYGYLVFVADGKADKRRRIYKAVEKYGAVLESEPIRAWNIDSWLQGKLKELDKEMDREAHAYFFEAVSMMQQISLEYLDRELDKLALFSGRRLVTKQELSHVLAEIPEISVFSLLDAVSERAGGKALRLLKRQIQDGVYLPLLLILLVRHVRQLWLAKSCMGKGLRGKELAKALDLNPFIAERLARAAGRFSEPLLKRVFLELSDADYALKTGQAGEEALEHVIILLCSEK